MKIQVRATLVLLLIACVVSTAAGCRRRKSRDSVVNRADIFTTDEFPGAPVQNGNTADDQRAMSPSSLNFNDEIKVTFNGERGTAMVTYQAEGVIYAHYFDGETWTPPVSLGALDCQYDFGVNGRQIVHAFLNTDTHASEAARERSGDCLILWSAPDTDGDAGGVADGENRCLWATYFDETLHTDPERRFGFQLEAVRVNSQDEDSEDVTTFGVASDGAAGEAAWGPNRNDVKWGDETTSIAVF